MTAILYLEGGGDSKEIHVRCREGFRRLLERSGFAGKMPRLVACGSRENAFDDFISAHLGHKGTFAALWIDSEEVLAELEEAWEHLQSRDHWARPVGAADEQVLFMTTCMETWLVADPAALSAHYGGNLHKKALPPSVDLERRDRKYIQTQLARATRDCGNPYEKGKRSFDLLAKLCPETLEQHLPSFARVRRILNAKL